MSEPTFPAPFGPFEVPVLALSGGGASAFVDPANPQEPPAPGGVRCDIYVPGHSVHWIQARLGLHTPSSVYEVLDLDGHELRVRGDVDGVQVWWVHDPASVAAAVRALPAPLVHLHGHGLARADRTLFYPRRDDTEARACSTFAPL